MTGEPVTITITGLPAGVEVLGFSAGVIDVLKELVPMVPGLAGRPVVVDSHETPRAPDASPMDDWQLRVAIRGLEGLDEWHRLVVAAVVLDRFLVWGGNVFPISEVECAVQGSEGRPWFYIRPNVSDDDLERMERWLNQAQQYLVEACSRAAKADDGAAAVQMRLIFSRIDEQLRLARRGLKGRISRRP